MATLYINESTFEDLTKLSNIGEIRAATILKQKSDLGGKFTAENILTFEDGHINNLFSTLMKDGLLSFDRKPFEKRMEELMKANVEHQNKVFRDLQNIIDQQNKETQLCLPMILCEP